VSTGAELAAIGNLPQVYAEATPHHLFLDESVIRTIGNYGKVNPPLRSKKEVAYLWKAIRAGDIDTIATDHAPHTQEEKGRSYWDAPSGMPGLETMLPLLLDSAARKMLSLSKIIELTAANPARIFGIKHKGLLSVGYDADIVIVDRKKKRTIKDEELFTKCKWSAFSGKTLTGWPIMTFVNGTCVFDHGAIIRAKAHEVVFE
jgi:dihydroorotase